MPALNEFSTFKVGKTWVLMIKYLIPIMLIGIWVFGVIKLFNDTNTFKIIVDIIITILVIGLSILFTKLPSKSLKD